jgi:hypothetical protein
MVQMELHGLIKLKMTKQIGDYFALKYSKDAIVKTLSLY